MFFNTSQIKTNYVGNELQKSRDEAKNGTYSYAISQAF